MPETELVPRESDLGPPEKSVCSIGSNLLDWCMMDPEEREFIIFAAKAGTISLCLLAVTVLIVISIFAGRWIL